MDVSLAAAAGAGLLTFASPCVLPLVPTYLALLAGSAGQGDTPRRAPVLAAVGFVLGLSSVFVALGVGASWAADVLERYRTVWMVAGGLVVVLLGLKMLGWLRLPWANREVRPLFHRLPSVGGPLGGFALGAAFGLGWTPCVGPVLAGVLTYAASTGADPWQSGALLGAYAAGLSVPLLAASFAAPAALRLLARLRRHTPVFEKVTGMALVAVGLVVASGRVELLAPDLKGSGSGGASAAAQDASCEGAGHACDADLGPISADGDPSSAQLAARPQLVEFVGATCPVCERMREVVAEAEDRCDADGAIARIDVSRPEGRTLARRYAVRAVPTFVSVDADGTEVTRLVGEQDIETVERALAEVRGDTCSLL